MDKWRLRVALKVLDEVKVNFPDTKQFMEEAMEQECLKEKITVEEVISFAILEKKSPGKTFFFCNECTRRYCIKLNLLRYNIYLPVI